MYMWVLQQQHSEDMKQENYVSYISVFDPFSETEILSYSTMLSNRLDY